MATSAAVTSLSLTADSARDGPTKARAYSTLATTPHRTAIQRNATVRVSYVDRPPPQASIRGIPPAVCRVCSGRARRSAAVEHGREREQARRPRREAEPEHELQEQCEPEHEAVARAPRGERHDEVRA